MKIVVLNDGKTFSGLEGCRICEVPDDWDIDAIERALDGDDLEGELNLADSRVILTLTADSVKGL